MADEEVTLDKSKDTAKEPTLQSGRMYNIKVKVNHLSVTLHFDPDDPERKDDSATLEAVDGSYRKTLPLSGGRVDGDSVTLKFRKVKPGKAYNFLIDPGSEGPPYYVAKNVMLTKDMLAQHMGG